MKNQINNQICGLAGPPAGIKNALVVAEIL
jgi:hypothetical protein